MIIKKKVVLYNSFSFILALTLLSPILVTITANLFIIVQDIIAGSQINVTLPLISKQKNLSPTEILHQLELFKKYSELKNVTIVGFPEIVSWSSNFDEFFFNIGLSGPNYDLNKYPLYNTKDWLLLEYKPILKSYENYKEHLIPDKSLIQNFIDFKNKSKAFSYWGFHDPIMYPKKQFFLVVAKYKTIDSAILDDINVNDINDLD